MTKTPVRVHKSPKIPFEYINQISFESDSIDIITEEFNNNNFSIETLVVNAIN